MDRIGKIVNTLKGQGIARGTHSEDGAVVNVIVESLEKEGNQPKFYERFESSLVTVVGENEPAKVLEPVEVQADAHKE